MKKVRFLLAVMVFMLATMTVEAAETITISQTKTTINVGDSVNLEVLGTEKVPAWTSYNTNIVKVDKQGKVTGMRKGTTKVRARVGYASQLCTVNVVDSSIKLNKQNTTIYHGGTSVNYVQLKATARGAMKNIEWVSEDETIAIVDSKGKVTSIAPGKTVITATANGKSASCNVTVEESSITLNMERINVSTRGVGSSIKVTPTIVGSKKNVKWTTSDKTVATVSGGKITGRKTGTATITATANGVSASCEAVVTQGLISINEEKILLYAGGLKADTKQLKTNAAKNDVVTWHSSDAAVASVNEKGLVAPVSEGKAIISAECNGNTDTCEVTVKQTSTRIIEDAVPLKTKGADKTYILKKEVIGKSASTKWTTSNNKVATVSNGKVTARKAGTATITATANGESDTVIVSVADFDPTIKLNQTQYTLYTVKGNAVNLKATVDGASKAVTWASSDTSVATVNKGKVVAVNGGTAVISASANGVTAECVVDVVESEVILDRYSVSLDKGEKTTVGYDIIGTSQSIKWTSTNNKVATVNKGTITAKNYGEADIRATANGVTSICHVNVTNCKHEYDNGVVTTEPTCGNNGVKTFTCRLCGDSYTEMLEATGKHKINKITVSEPDCENEGLVRHECEVCGFCEKEDNVKELGHRWSEWDVIEQPTENKDGINARKCDRCGQEQRISIPFEEKDKHTHNFTFRRVERKPTCNKEGVTTGYCECGESQILETIPATGHGWYVSYEQELTCTDDAFTEYMCKYCGETYNDNIVKAKGHDFEETIVEPTCTENGYAKRICNVCGFEENEIKWTSSHTDGEWVNIGNDCIMQHREKYCTKCGKMIASEDVPTGKPHDFEHVVEAEANCIQDGFEKDVCKVCGKTKNEHTITGGYHKYSDWAITKQPADGIAERVSDFGIRECHCIYCGDTVEESIVRIEIEDGQSTEVYLQYLFDEANSIFDKVNDLRAREGKTPYGQDEVYKDLCAIRTAEIAYKYGHDRPSGKESFVNRDGYMEKPAENIACGQYTAEDVFNSWDNSPGHHANMVHPLYRSYYCVGAKVDNDTPIQYHYWVQLFGRNSFDDIMDPAHAPKSEETSAFTEDPSEEDVIEEEPVEEEILPEEIEEFSIIYNSSDVTDSNTYKNGDVAIILDFTGELQENARFVGWSTSDGEDAIYFAEDTITMKETLTLYPMFKYEEPEEISEATEEIDDSENEVEEQESEPLENSENSENVELTEESN